MKKYIGILIGTALLTTTVFAKQITTKIEVLFNDVKIEVNGKKVESDNIVYKGTTYVPLRSVSELLSKDVEWNGETKLAKINDKSIDKESPVVTMEMNSGEKIKIQLYPNIAPNTVSNFISLINKEYYNGLNFHRVIPGFMIQGGDPLANGTGGPGYSIKGEFMKNGVANNILHTRGVISMARSRHPDSAGSQFFIVVEDSHDLNGDYAGFGKVIEGMDVVDKIVNSKRDESDNPLTPQVIKNIKVDLFGKNYEEPKILK